MSSETECVFGVKDAVYELLTSIGAKNEFLLIPPSIDAVTDDESDSVCGEEQDVTTLSKEISGAIELESSDDEASSTSSSSSREGAPSKKKMKPTNASGDPCWKKTPPKYSLQQNQTDAIPQRSKELLESLKNLTPTMLFEKFFDEQLQNQIIENSIAYARKNNRQDFEFTKEDLKRFLGLLILAGYLIVPNERYYWHEHLSVPIVAATMSRDRFKEIKQNLCFTNNTPTDNSTNKMFQIKPLLDAFQANSCQWGVFHENLSIGEFMVTHFENNPGKQFVRCRPITFGYRNWAVTSSDGYCYALDVYCGKSEDSKPEDLARQVAKSLLEKLNCCPQEHKVYFDDYFTSYNLLKDLRDLGYRASGNIAASRALNCPLMSVQEFKKAPADTYDYGFDEKNEILFFRWKGYGARIIGTNFDDIESISKKKLWCGIKNNKVEVDVPRVYLNYKEGVNGLQKMWKSVSAYRIALNGRKWWWIIFTYLVDIAVSNAWRLHCMAASEENKSPMSLLNFRRSIVTYYLCDKIFEPESNESESEDD